MPNISASENRAIQERQEAWENATKPEVVAALLSTVQNGFMVPAIPCTFEGDKVEIAGYDDGMAMLKIGLRGGLLQCPLGLPGEVVEFNGSEYEITDVEIGRLNDWMASGLPKAWDHAYSGIDGYAWAQNPWVWMIRWRTL